MNATSSENIFGLIRHAQTIGNVEKRIQGQNDTPLTAKGVNQAKRWGRQLKLFNWDRIIVSNADRALRTAALINATLNIPLGEDAQLSEQDWGEWTGKTLAQIKKEVPQIWGEQENAGWEFCPPGGENRNSVWERSHKALKEAVGKWPGRKILVITHEGVIKSLIYRLSGRKFLPSESPLLFKNHLHLLIYDKKGLRVKHINTLALSGS